MQSELPRRAIPGVLEKNGRINKSKHVDVLLLVVSSAKRKYWERRFSRKPVLLSTIVKEVPELW